MNVHISFCNQTTFTKCTAQKVLENLIVLYFKIFSWLAASLQNENVKLIKNELFQIVKLTKQTTLSFLTYHEYFFFRWTMYRVIINYLVNPKFSFCFHYAIKWAKKVYLPLIIKKEQKIWHNPLKCCVPFSTSEPNTRKDPWES